MPPTAFSNYDTSDVNCVHCLTPTLFTDYAQGDIICTTCGVVQVQHIQYDGPDWRDYSAMDDSKDRKVNAARAGSIVDEQRWRGGLEPTSIGQVFGGSYSGDAERQRKKLNNVKRVVDHWVDKQFEKRVEESRLAMKVREKKKQRGEIDDDEFTNLGTNEHEMIVRQRDQIESDSNTVLVSEKWSLDRALLLHGSSDELPRIYTEYNPLTGRQPKDPDEERDILLKRMDATQKKASVSLYKAHSLIQGALRRLNLSESVGVYAEIMDVVCRYVNIKGSFTVKGVSSRIDSKSNSDSKKSANVEQQRNYNKARQMAALGSAFIYLICKKNGLGRALAEICSSFEYQDFYSPSNKNERSSNSDRETFIKAKHCSKAMTEIRTLMPEYIQSVTLASNSNAKSSSDVTRTSESTSSTNFTATASTSINSIGQNNDSHATTSMTNLIQHSISKLNLTPAAMAAITSLVLYEQKDASAKGGMIIKPNVLIAAVTHLVCDAGATMQKFASQAIKNQAKPESIKSNIKFKVEVKAEIKVKVEPSQLKIESGTQQGQSVKRKHIRPGSNRSMKRRRTDAAISSSMDIKPKSVTPEPFDALSHAPINNESITSMASWEEWSNEKPWSRTMQSIEDCCNISSTAMTECFRKQIYPRRKELLEVLQTNFASHTIMGGSRMDALMAKFPVAAPLMSVSKK